MPALLLRSIFIFMVACLSACATNDGLRAERAQQVDLQTLYLKTLENNYAPQSAGGKGQLDIVIQKYASMEDQRADNTKRAREADATKIALLKEDLNRLEALISTLKEHDAALQSKKRGADSIIVAQQKKLRINANDAKADDLLSMAQNDKADIEAAIEANKRDLDDATAKRTVQQTAIAALINKDYTVEADEPRRKYRNGVINDFLAIADFHYYEFKNLLMSGRANSDTLLDISELLLSTATTLTGGLTAKTNLGASSTLLKGSRAAVDKNFFVQQTLAAIINGIEDRRQKDRADIVNKMQQTTDLYPLAQGLSDVQLYQSRASLVAGAMAVANETANKSNKSEQELQKAQLDMK
jgi:hypothetical protein